MKAAEKDIAAGVVFSERAVAGVSASQPPELLEVSFGMTLPPIEVALGNDAMDLRLSSEPPATVRALEGFES